MLVEEVPKWLIDMGKVLGNRLIIYSEYKYAYEKFKEEVLRGRGSIPLDDIISWFDKNLFRKEVIRMAKGKCSWFGGPMDKGVAENEMLAFYPDHRARTLNTVGALYCALPIFLKPTLITQTLKDFLRDKVIVKVVNTVKNKVVWCRLVDVGPGIGSRVVDLSMKAMKDLEANTDDEVEVYLEQSFASSISMPPGVDIGGQKLFLSDKEMEAYKDA
jgi:hypothetical protein